VCAGSSYPARAMMPRMSGAGWRAELRATLVLALPIVGSQLAHVSLGFVDTIMIGRLGSRSLAAGALGNSLFFPLALVGMAMLSAASPMVAQAFGSGRRQAAGEAARQGIWLAAALTVPAFLLLWNAAPLLRRLGQEPDVVAATGSFLRPLACGFFPFLAFYALRYFVEAVERPRWVTAIAVGGAALNVLGNYALMYGRLGFPALGLVGSGITTAIVYWSMLLALALHVRRDPDLAPYRVLELGRPDPRQLRELVRIGWPLGLMQGLETTLFAATAILMGTLGAGILAAHQIALQCAAFTFMVPVGISLATGVRVGHAVGRDDPGGVRRAGWSGIGLGAAFMAAAAAAFLLLPRPIVGLYLDLDDPANRAVVELAVTLLGIAALFQVFDGIQVTAAGALRGLKDTRAPMLLALLAYWGIGLPTGWLLAFGLGRGGPGLWTGLVLGLAAAAALLALRFARHAGRAW